MHTHMRAHIHTQTHHTHVYTRLPTSSSRKVPVRLGQEREGGLPGWFPTSIMKFGPGQSCSLKGRVFDSVSFFLFYLLSLTGSTRCVAPAHACLPASHFPPPPHPKCSGFVEGKGLGEGFTCSSPLVSKRLQLLHDVFDPTCTEHMYQYFLSPVGEFI